MFVAGLSAVVAHDTANIKKYFNQLMRKKTDKEQVYSYLFNVYKAEGNMDQAMKVASNFQKNQKNNYKAYLLLAEGYFLNQNYEKGKEVISQLLILTKDSVNLYPDVLTAAGGKGHDDRNGLLGVVNGRLGFFLLWLFCFGLRLRF